VEVKILDEHESDCKVCEDEEVEAVSQPEIPVELKPGMSQELAGIDDDVFPIEECRASVLGHDAAVEDRRMRPEIVDHPDLHKSAKAQAKLDGEITHMSIMAGNRKHETDGLIEKIHRRFLRVSRRLSQ
jgi:hypothetical protein